MVRNRSVRKIFWRSSLTRNMVTRRDCASPWNGLRTSEPTAAMCSPPRSSLAWAWFHFIALGLLGRRNYLGRASLGGDLLLGRLRKVVGTHGQPPGNFPVTQYTYPICRSLGKASFLQGGRIDSIAVLECCVEIADIHHVEMALPHALAEAALGNA